MKVSELRSTLAAFEDAFGDIPVVLVESGHGTIHEVEFINISENFERVELE